MVKKWEQWYKGGVADFHNYTVYNGDAKISCTRNTLNMGKKVCEDWADLLMNEKVKIHVDNGKGETYGFVNEVFDDNKFWVKINEAQEYKAALGTTAYIPYIVGATVTEAGINGGAVKIDYITAENIFPLSWENGKITECAFAGEKSIDGKIYVYLQMHTIQSGLYVIENLLFETLENSGAELRIVEDITSVKGFENVAARVETGSDKRQFVIDRLNTANNISRNNPLGLPVFASAVDILKGIDLVYDSYNNEFLLGKKRVMVKAEATKFSDSKPVFDPNDLTYYRLPADMNDEPFIKEIDMKIRADEHEKALQIMLNLLSAKCGFGENHYQFEKSAVKTATEVISQNSAMFRSLKKHELILEDALIELVRIIIRLGNIIRGNLNEDAAVTVDFDDSVIEDSAQIKAQATVEYQTGLIDAVEYFVKVYNLTEDEAAAKVAKMEARKANGGSQAENETGIDWASIT